MKGHLLKALVLLLTLTSTVMAQYSFDFSGAGARAEGMGKAYLGLSDDVYSASWNPAGLYVIEKPVMGVSWGSMSPKGASNAITLSQYFHAEHAGSYGNLTAINFAAPFRIKGHPFVGSFSYTRNCDLFETISARAGFDQYVAINTGDGLLFLDTQYVDMHINILNQGGLNSANFAFASRLYGNTSIGVGVNVYGGRALHEEQNLFYIEDSPYGIYQDGFAILDSTVVDTNKFSGTNFTVGFKHTADKLTTGLVIRTPFTMRVEWDEAYYKVLSMNGVILDDGTDTVYIMDQLMEYDMPWMFGVGVGYNVTENWLLAADAELQAYSGGKVRYRTSITINPGGDNIEEFVEIDPQWNNVLALRLGSEYLWHTGVGTVPLRAGLGMMPSANPNYDADGNTSKATTYSGSLGAGIHWEQIHFDLAYTISTIDRQYYGIYDYTNRNHHINFGFTGVF